MLPPLASNFLRGCDVALLRVFVATAQQDDNRDGMPEIINSIARAYVNAQLTDTLPDYVSIAEYATRQTKQASFDQRLNAVISQFKQPPAKCLGLDNLYHPTIVV